MSSPSDTEKSKIIRIDRFPFPIFGAKWVDDRLLIYGGAGAKFGMPCGVFVLHRINANTHAAVDNQIRIQGSRETFASAQFVAATETVWNAVFYHRISKNTKQKTVESIVATPKNFQFAAIHWGKSDGHETYQCITDLPPFNEKGDISCTFDAVSNSLVHPQSCAVFTRRGHKATQRSRRQPKWVIYSYRTSAKAYIGAALCTLHGFEREPVVAIDDFYSNKWLDANPPKGQPADGLEIVTIKGLAVLGAQTQYFVAVVAEDAPQKLARSRRMTLCKVTENGDLEAISTLGEILAKADRTTCCFWILNGSLPVLCTAHVTATKSYLKKYAFKWCEGLQHIETVPLVNDKVTACDTFAQPLETYLAIGTASGKILIYSVEKRSIIRHCRLMSAPMTCIAVRSYDCPLICATSLSGECKIITPGEITLAVSAVQWIALCIMFGCLAFLCSRLRLAEWL